MTQLRTIALIATCGFGGCVTASAENPAINDSAYVSDHLSFIGYNGSAVLLVLGRLKSRDGLHYGERYLAAIYQEATGWERLPVTLNEVEPHYSGTPGNGDYPSFKVEGNMAGGLTISSRTNGTTLQTKPSSYTFSHQVGASKFTVEAAEGSLTYGSLKVEGWVVHEHLLTQETSRWRQFLTGTPFHEFGRMFVRAGHSGMVYLHVEEDGFKGGAAKGASGFTILKGKLEEVHDVNIKFTSLESAAGFFSWVRKAELTWHTDQAEATLRTEAVQKLELANWLIGGATIDGLGGELKYRDQTLPVFGFFEGLK